MKKQIKSLEEIHVNKIKIREIVYCSKKHSIIVFSFLNDEAYNYEMNIKKDGSLFQKVYVQHGFKSHGKEKCAFCKKREKGYICEFLNNNINTLYNITINHPKLRLRALFL